MINPKEQELLNLRYELQELLEDGEDNQLLRDKIQELEKELKGNNNGVWVNNLLEVIKENNIEFGSDKE